MKKAFMTLFFVSIVVLIATASSPPANTMNGSLTTVVSKNVCKVEANVTPAANFVISGIEAKTGVLFTGITINDQVFYNKESKNLKVVTSEKTQMVKTRVTVEVLPVKKGFDVTGSFSPVVGIMPTYAFSSAMAIHIYTAAISSASSPSPTQFMMQMLQINVPARLIA